jgi:hypothetical protein
LEVYQRACTRAEGVALTYLEEVEQIKEACRRQEGRAAKIPEIKLREFHGSVQEYPAWRNHFRAQVEERPGLSDVDRLEYLFQMCKGSAARLLKRYNATSANFPVVMCVLEERYGRQGEIIEQTFRSINRLKLATSSPQASLELIDELTALVAVLAQHDRNIEDPTFTSSILTGIKPKIYLEAISNWRRYCKRQGWDNGTHLPRMM